MGQLSQKLQEIQLDKVSDKCFQFQFYLSENNYKPYSVMLDEDQIQKQQRLHIYIPEIKRPHAVSSLGTKTESGKQPLVSQSPFHSFQIQFQDVKSDLGLRTENSTFTKVSSADEEFGDNSKQEHTRATFFSEEPDLYKADLHKFLKLLQKSSQQQQKDPSQLTLNTKNILRNICNAQNQYILFNPKALQIISIHLKDPQKFKSWVNSMRLHTFQEFQKVWGTRKKSIFTKLYKKLCRKFYVENAVPYIINSRMRNKETKKAHVMYLYRFLEGIENPQTFFYFKQKDNKNQLRQEKDAL